MRWFKRKSKKVQKMWRKYIIWKRQKQLHKSQLEKNDKSDTESCSIASSGSFEVTDIEYEMRKYLEEINFNQGNIAINDFIKFVCFSGQAMLS